MTALKEITTSQLLILLGNAPDGEKVDLSRLDFRKVDMRNTEVRDKFMAITDHAANPRGQTPYFVDLMYANISGRDFSNYNLSHVIMTGVTAEHTVFAGADLSDAHLDDSTLDYADMRYTKLHFAKLYHASIVGTNFTGADISSAYGLRLRNPDKDTVERLGVVSSIRDAILPEEAEEYRARIQKRVDQHFPHKNPASAKVRRRASEGW